MYGKFLLTDQVGTLRAVADTSGNIVKRVDYDSFGNIIADTNPAFTVPFGFAGGLHDRDTGLVRFGYRDYSPELGRFTAKDPIDFDGGDTNLYAYVLNDPVNFVDPLGLDLCEVKCCTRRFFHIYYCKMQWSVDVAECREAPIVSRDCYKKAKDQYDNCMQVFEASYIKCLRDCIEDKPKKPPIPGQCH